MVDGDLDIQFGQGVQFTLRDVRVLEHSAPLILLGSDLLRGGRPVDQWNFGGLVQTSGTGGKVTGSLVFEKSGDTRKCELFFCPSSAGNPFTAPGAVHCVTGGGDGAVSVAATPLSEPGNLFRSLFERHLG